MSRSRGVLAALVVWSALLAACDRCETAEENTAAQAPVMADRETATPVGTEELFFGEVSGFSPPPPMGGSDAVVSILTQQAKARDDTSMPETKPTNRVPIPRTLVT